MFQENDRYKGICVDGKFNYYYFFINIYYINGK
jgi:hypothetical protein